MTIESHKRNPAFIDWRRGYTGRPASAVTLGQTMQGAASHCINWRFNGVIAAYSGLWNDNQNPDTGTFYVILSGPEKADGTNRRLCIAHMGWPTAIDGEVLIEYTDPDASTVTVYDSMNTGGFSVANSSRIGDQVPLGNLWIHTMSKAAGLGASVPLSWAPDGANYFRVAEISFAEYQFAALTVLEVPPGALSDTQEQVTKGSVASGEPIMGYDGSAVVSLGGIHQMIGDGDDHVESVERIGRRCLFQQMHPVGVWSNASNYTNIYEENFIVRPRDLIDPTSTPEIWSLPAFVITNTSAAAKIKLTNTSTADTWVWEASGANAATLISAADGTPSTGLNLELGQYTEITVEYDAGTLVTDDLTIHTASLWEGPQWGTTP